MRQISVNADVITTQWALNIGFKNKDDSTLQSTLDCIDKDNSKTVFWDFRPT